MKKIIAVEGMHCQHCQASVEKALSQIDGVESAKVDLAKKTPPSPFPTRSMTRFSSRPLPTPGLSREPSPRKKAFSAVRRNR